MDVHVSLVGHLSVADQIHVQLRDAIRRGELASGERLPSSRELAHRLSVSRTTVTAAYDRMHAEGLLDSRQGVGVFVAPRDHAYRLTPTTVESADGLEPQALWDEIDVTPDYSADKPEFDFRAGIPALDYFPFPAWRARLASHLRYAEVCSSAYGDPCGLPVLREALTRHLAVSRGVRTDPARIVITSGAQQAFDLIARVLLQPGDLVAVEDPGYSAPRKLYRSLRLRVAPVPVDAEGIVVAAIPAEARLIYVTPSHQFPLGHVLSQARRAELLNRADQIGAVIVEDDYDSEFRYGGRPLDTLQGIDASGRVVYVSTFSKVLLPSLRLGFLVAPPSLLSAMRKAKQTTDWFTSTPGQAALASFIRDGQFARHVKRMRRVYEQRHYLLADLLDNQLTGWLERIPSYAGIHVAALLRPHVRLSDRELVERAARAGIGLSEAISHFSADGESPRGVLLGYGAIPTHRIRPGLARLETALRQGRALTTHA
jgi:GntR family transcriptional regulator/MocR family aminotransferase